MRRSVSGLRLRLAMTLRRLLRLAVTVLRLLRLSVAVLLRRLRRRAVSAATTRGRAARRSPATPALHQNFTDEPQPQLPVTFGLLNLKPEP